MDGFLIINKPAGPTSADVTNRLKFLLPKINGKKPKIGHGGTLDPLATGLLPIGIGRATKQLQALLDGPKTYIFTVTFGTQTTTDDTEGPAIATSDIRPTTGQIQAILPQFTGSIEQTPPAFSALKIEGQRAYDVARSGQKVELPARPVTIHSFKMLENTPETATFEAHVSKGTYVRSLARDIALALDTVGHVSRLERTAHGPFTLQHAVTLDKIRETADITANLLPLDADLARS
ncbi:MAG TPA: tRNA pseudouridine(55) synthase TruB [Alphaproteobacteria bacterium]|nr:tRNA pseudouridine(55) synthase TruB [Alphaproteobacteria bacterium]